MLSTAGSFGNYADMLAFILSTVCPRSLDPIYIVTYYIIWVKTSWTDSIT